MMTINSCAKKGAPIRVDDLIRKVKFECETTVENTCTKEAFFGITGQSESHDTAVSGNGVGIMQVMSEEVLERAFQEFYLVNQGSIPESATNVS